MGAIFRREMNSYFTSPLAYVYFAVFNLFAGLFFFSYCIGYGSSDMSGVFSNMFTILLFLIPILTMRLLSEERKQKTDQGLLTSPVSLIEIVLGKYFAALAIFAISLLTFVLYAIILAGFTQITWAVIIGNICGILLLGIAFISIGLFISSLTESQVVAAILSFVVMMMIFLIDFLGYSIANTTIKNAVESLSFQQRYQSFTSGIFSIPATIFFLSVAVIFNFLTIRILERRRWA